MKEEEKLISEKINHYGISEKKMEDYRKIFEGLAYTIIEDDEASIVLLEGKPIAASCIEHGNHDLLDLNCPHVEKLLKKVFS